MAAILAASLPPLQSRIQRLRSRPFINGAAILAALLF